MSHEWESGYLGGREPAWHGLGTVIDEDVIQAARAIRESGLGWGVAKRPLYVEGLSGEGDGYVAIDGWHAVVRDSDNATLGVVGDSWTPVQNEDAFAFMDELLGSGEAKFHTAMSLRGGRQVGILARIPRDILIGGEESERIAPFLFLENWHTGTGSLTVATTPVRVQCANTAALALRRAVRSWSTRHTQGIDGRLVEARKTLELTFRYYDTLEAMGNDLITRKLSGWEERRFVERLIDYPEELLERIRLGVSPDGGRAARNIEEAREAVLGIMRNSDDLQNVRGTAWGALQAVTEYADWGRDVRETKHSSAQERRFLRTIEDRALKQRALAILAPDWTQESGDSLAVLREVAEPVAATA